MPKPRRLSTAQLWFFVARRLAVLALDFLFFALLLGASAFLAFAL